MVVIINGAFGVGKSTVVRILHRRLRGSITFDPERIGFILHRLPTFIPCSTKRFEDYQDSPFWRSITIRLAAWHGRRHDIVLIPMCFSNLAYLAEIRSGIEARGYQVLHLCLTASWATIESRLRARGVDRHSTEGRWIYPRAQSAGKLHLLPEFALQIPTDDRRADKVADDICLQIEKRIVHGF